jgi:peptide/nickel transport system substrate-binding protein
MHMMRAGRRRAALLLTISVIALVACDSNGNPTVDASPGLDGDSAPVEGGTVIVAADQQPTTLNALAPDGHMAANEVVWSAVLSPLWRITPSAVYEPLLLDGEPEIGTDPFSVTYTLREGLEWSDGEPLTVDDVVFTHETILAQDVDVVARQGHRLVRRTHVMGDRRVRFEFRRPFAAWRSMFSEPRSAILPRHLLDGKDVAAQWDDRLPVASGPFEFDTWQRGQRLVLKRNESYWGPRAHLDEVVLTFHADAQAQIDALAAGDADVIAPDATLAQIEQLDASDAAQTDVRPGLAWETIDFNLTTAPTNRAFVRLAIARAIDRAALVSALTWNVNPAPEPLSNVLLLRGHPAYADHWSTVIGYDPAAAEDLLVRNGCTKPGDVYVCDGEPLTLDYLTTTDVDGRIELLDRIREDLAAVGIRLNPRLVTSAQLRAAAASEDQPWDVVSFWRAGHPGVWDAASGWRCEAPRRVSLGGYCNQAVDGLLDAAARILDTEQRDRLWNEADAVIARDVPTVPLYQQQTVLAWHVRIDGPANNPTAWGPLWNVGQWRLTQ